VTAAFPDMQASVDAGLHQFAVQVDGAAGGCAPAFRLPEGGRVCACALKRGGA
jgi:hypothetical protein